MFAPLPPDSHVKALIPSVMVYGGEGSGRLSGHEDRALCIGLVMPL